MGYTVRRLEEDTGWTIGLQHAEAGGRHELDNLATPCGGWRKTRTGQWATACGVWRKTRAGQLGYSVRRLEEDTDWTIRLHRAKAGERHGLDNWATPCGELEVDTDWTIRKQRAEAGERYGLDNQETACGGWRKKLT